MAQDLAGLLLIREVEEFLIHEARLLDARRFEDWMALFADDGDYWVPAAPDQESPTEAVSIFYEDRALMDVRVRLLSHPANYAQLPPSRTRHLIANITVEDHGGEVAGEIAVRSSLVMAEYRDGRQRVFAADCRHRLRREDGGFRIVRKRVDLVDCDAVHGGMSVPF